ncbi:hypothetical protein MATL_G00193030 [Megalops atlanticus]|uniref:Uncharacterized protein n=1 Tax=Megalops atlanticus TaxID=7932 RepID=A0A9D3PJ37_MEGAT|nr:hypothetical protein MATL_G00193030 [Megalops atlanticus]
MAEPLPSTACTQHIAEGQRTMAPAHRLLATVALLAAVLTECSCSVIPVKEITECFKTEFSAARKKNCRFNADCEDEKTTDAIKTCLLYGFDLIFQDSTYHMKNDYDTYRLVECAIEECFEGVKAYRRRQRGRPTEVLSGFAEPVYHCLLAVRECVVSETMWDE